jgi:hypothetical protein
LGVLEARREPSISPITQSAAPNSKAPAARN